jgi:hypothetical protein
MHLEIASYSVGALFRQVFLILQWTSEQYCSQGCASYCGLMFPSTGRASAGLDGVVEHLPVVRMINF